MITVSQDDVDTEKGSRSRLKVGTQLARSEMLHLALMASENRAAHALGRNFPGGSEAFVAAMNGKAQAARHERHEARRAHGPVEPPTSQAHAILPPCSRRRTSTPIIRELSTSPALPGRGRPAQSGSSTTPTGLVSSPQSGTSACRRPATSPKPAAAW